MKKLSAVAILVLGCGGGDQLAANEAAATASPAPMVVASTVPVQMVFEGLMAFEQLDKTAPEKGMYALMVDAKGANPAADRPPCATAPADQYPDHTTAIYVEGGKLSLSIDGGAPTDPGNLVKIEDEDIKIAVDPPSPYVTTPASLTKLVDPYELKFASLNADNGKIVIDRAVYLDPDEMAPYRLPNLAGRVLIDSGVAAARANVCAISPDGIPPGGRPTPNKQALFGFKEIGKADDPYCKPPSVPFPVELGEDVLVTLQAAKSVTLTMVGDPGTGRRERKLVIESDGTSKRIRIGFRNVMDGYKGVSEKDLCLAHRHLETYQWLYNLTADPKAGSGCKWIPCVHPDTGTAGGGKCPNPGP